MNQRESNSQRQAIKTILAKYVSKREARQALLGDISGIDGMQMIVNFDEQGRNCNEYIKYGEPITEDAFWKAWTRIQRL
jgi:hypothetical protein